MIAFYIILLNILVTNSKGLSYGAVSNTSCHPGFRFNGKECVCNKNIKGIERCVDQRYLYLKEGVWAGVVDNTLITYVCPREYCICNKTNAQSGVKECFYDYENPNDICRTGRKDILCGRCDKGLSVGLRPSDCRDCSGTWFIAGSFIIVVVFTLAIIYFNPGIPPDLRGILFFVQVLPFVFTPNETTGDVITFVTAILDFGRPSDYPFKTCAINGLGNLGIIALNYITPLTIFVILFFFYIFQRKINLKRNRPFQAFFILLIMMYKYLTETSLLILHCVDIGGEDVFYYDGALKCYTGYHLGFAILAGFILIVFVVAPVFIIFMLIVCVCFHVNNAVLDIVTHGLKRCSHPQTTRRRSHFENESDEQEDQNNCLQCQWWTELWRINFGQDKGWWWSVDLTRRVIIVAAFVYFQDENAKQTALTIAFLVILTVHCVNQPYDNTKKHANIIETWYLFFLAALSTVQMMFNQQSNKDIITISIVSVSYGFAFFYFLYKVCLFSLNKIRGRTNHDQDRIDGSIPTHLSAITVINDRLEHDCALEST